MGKEQFKLGIVAGVVLFVVAASFASAGTKAKPEISDAAGDNTVVCNASCQFTNGDLLYTYLTVAGPNLMVHIGITGAGTPSQSTTYTYTLSFKGDKDYTASAVLKPLSPAGDGSIAPGGVATTAAAAGDNEIVLGIPVAALGASTTLTNLFVTANGVVVSDPAQNSKDRAPDGTAFGTDYAVAGSGAGGNTTATGTSTNSTSSTATSGTTSSGTGTSGTTSGTSTGTGTTTGTATKTSTTSTSTTSGTGSGTSSSQTGFDRVTGDQQGYTIASAAAAGVVLVLSLIGRFGRWG